MRTDSLSPSWSGKSRGGAIGNLFFIYAVRLFGVNFAYAVMSVVLFYFFVTSPKTVDAIWLYNRNIRKLSRLLSIKELYAHYYLFGQTLIDRAAMNNARLIKRYRFKFDNYNEFINILENGRGAIMLGAHVGCWRAGSRFFGKYAGKINIVMYDGEAIKIKNAIEKSSISKDGFKTILINNMIDAVFQINNALENGECVCFNADRFMENERTMESVLLQKKALFPAGPFLLASRYRVPVVFFYSMREKGRSYRFIFDVFDSSRGISPETLLGQYTGSLEKILRKYPRQWFNFYRFWENETVSSNKKGLRK